MSKLLKELKQGFRVDSFDRKPIMGVLDYSKEYTPGAEILPPDLEYAVRVGYEVLLGNEVYCHPRLIEQNEERILEQLAGQIYGEFIPVLYKIANDICSGEITKASANINRVIRAMMDDREIGE